MGSTISKDALEAKGRQLEKHISTLVRRSKHYERKERRLRTKIFMAIRRKDEHLATKFAAESLQVRAMIIEYIALAKSMRPVQKLVEAQLKNRPFATLRFKLFPSPAPALPVQSFGNTIDRLRYMWKIAGFPHIRELDAFSGNDAVCQVICEVMEEKGVPPYVQVPFISSLMTSAESDDEEEQEREQEEEEEKEEEEEEEEEQEEEEQEFEQ